MKKIEVKPNVNKDEPVPCPICNSTINRIWTEKNRVYIACEEGHVLEATEIKT